MPVNLRNVTALRRLRNEPSQCSDAELLNLIADGSETAFRALWERYGGAILRICGAVLKDPVAAEDAAQEAMVRVWRSAGTVDERRGIPAAWLYTVARNAARNVARIRTPIPVEPTDIAAEDAFEQRLVDRFWIDSALARLPSEEREAIELSYFRGLSHSQVAAALGAPLGTVKSRIRRGMARLADHEEAADA